MTVLEAAAEWGMAPWLVEDAPALWMDRRQEWARAKNAQAEHSLKKSESKSKAKSKRGPAKGDRRVRQLF